MSEYPYTITEHYHCPKCGSTEVSYYEDVHQYWYILGTTNDGTVLIDNGSLEYGDADSSNARFDCYNCGHSWPASDVQYGFVDDGDFTYAQPDNEPPELMTDAEADADVLRMAGMGTDEDYGYYGDN